MKKFIFSAIAMIAFMGSSMANTKEVDSKSFLDYEIINNLDAQQADRGTKDNCGGVWAATRIYALNQGFTVSQADSIAMAAYLKCVGVPDDATNDLGVMC